MISYSIAPISIIRHHPPLLLFTSSRMLSAFRVINGLSELSPVARRGESGGKRSSSPDARPFGGGDWRGRASAAGLGSLGALGVWYCA